MKIILLSLLFPLCLFAQGNSTDRKELQDLLAQRKQQFDSYSGSLEKHSGFFGNKTKKDILHSNDVLIELVRTDNRIISALNRVVDFRTFEKVNMNYDLAQREENLENLRHATDTLTKQVDALAISNASLKSKTRRMRWMVYTLSFLIVTLLFVAWRKRTASR